MSSIPIGAKGERLLTVTPEVAISFLNHKEARVLATPWLIAYLEMTARDLVKPYLLDGEDTVGTQVTVSHLGASPIGAQVRFEAEVLSVEGRRVIYRVEAWDSHEKIAEGTHERFAVNIERFAARVQAKRSVAPEKS